MSQQLQKTNFEIWQKRQLIYSLDRHIARNKIENSELLFKIEIIQDEIKELEE